MPAADPGAGDVAAAAVPGVHDDPSVTSIQAARWLANRNRSAANRASRSSMTSGGGGSARPSPRLIPAWSRPVGTSEGIDTRW